jgi:hypothetical protein
MKQPRGNPMLLMLLATLSFLPGTVPVEGMIIPQPSSWAMVVGTVAMLGLSAFRTSGRR